MACQDNFRSCLKSLVATVMSSKKRLSAPRFSLFGASPDRKIERKQLTKLDIAVFFGLLRLLLRECPESRHEELK